MIVENYRGRRGGCRYWLYSRKSRREGCAYILYIVDKFLTMSSFQPSLRYFVTVGLTLFSENEAFIFDLSDVLKLSKY